MKQQKRCIGYPGSSSLCDYEVFCPECKEWKDDYGEVDTQDGDGDWHCLCLLCGDKVFPQEEDTNHV